MRKMRSQPISYGSAGFLLRQLASVVHGSRGFFILALLPFSPENSSLRAPPSWGRWGHEQQTGAAGKRMPSLPRNRLCCSRAADKNRALFA